MGKKEGALLKTRHVTISAAAFDGRFSCHDVQAALSGYTPACDTRIVLSLLRHVRPLRILEIGTALGQMTANLTFFSPKEAIVFTIGIVDPPLFQGAGPQHCEIPKREELALFVNYFGTGDKAMFIAGDSRDYNFDRCAPLDFVFVDGGHDIETVKSDSENAYRALRPGGCLVWHDFPSATPWVEVERAVLELGFDEPVYSVSGTQVAFLFKGEWCQAPPSRILEPPSIGWDGEFSVVTSMAAVNRGICKELIARGHNISLIDQHFRTIGASEYSLAGSGMEKFLNRKLIPMVNVRHGWPPTFLPPKNDGFFVLVQPWEFGRLPRAWVEQINAMVDELWVPSCFVQKMYIESGVPPSRVAVVPNGYDPTVYKHGCTTMELPTDKSVRLLFLGGTLRRKGIDVLLEAYRRAFSHSDDVVLVIKDLGAKTFYKDQAATEQITNFSQDTRNPSVIYLTEDLSESDIAALYSACSALVYPYRGEGFALPVLEAMACGVPVVVTRGGPTDEFVPSTAGWHIPARRMYFRDEEVAGLPAAGRPWMLEPDVDSLAALLREIAGDCNARGLRGQMASRAAIAWTWARTATVIEERIEALRGRPPVRFARRTRS